MNDDEDEIDICVERREAVTKRLCAVMGWEYGKKPIWAGLRKIAFAEATAVGIDRLEEIVTALEAKAERDALKAESEEIYRHLEHCRIERDALAVTAERLRESLVFWFSQSTVGIEEETARARAILKETAP